MSETVAAGNYANIPCVNTQLHWNPFEKFFFYYIGNKIVMIDDGHTDQTGDACSLKNSPVSSTFSSVTLPGGAINFVSEPTFFSGFTYMSVDYANGTSTVIKWPVTYDGTTWASTAATELSATLRDNTNKIRDLVARTDIGLYFVKTGTNGYFYYYIVGTTGNLRATQPAANQKETTTTWRLFQAPINAEQHRPVYASPLNDPDTLYKLTNEKAIFYDEPTAPYTYNFHTWPTKFGRYHAIQARPGTCAQNMVGANYDKMHVLVIDLHNYAHYTCIDDSEDVWCGDAKWQPDLSVVYDNREVCDDGNNISGDGCTSDCKTIEPYWTCVNSHYLKTNCTYVACGNGIYDAVDALKGAAVSE